MGILRPQNTSNGFARVFFVSLGEPDVRYVCYSVILVYAQDKTDLKIICYD